MGFNKDIRWVGNAGSIEEQLLAQAEREREHREQAVIEQMSLRASGSPLPNPGMPLMGRDIGSQLSYENARRRANAMTAEELAQLYATGKTDVAAWNENAGGGRGMDENQAGGEPRGFGGKSSAKKDVNSVNSDKEPSGPRLVDPGQGDRHSYEPTEEVWQKNMREVQEERMKSTEPAPIFTRPTAQQRKENEEIGRADRNTAPLSEDEKRRRKLKGGFRF